MDRPILVQTRDGYWLLLRGADHTPTRDPIEMARRIQAVTNEPERYQYLVPDLDINRCEFRLAVAEERRRLRDQWEADVREAESVEIPWFECI